MQKAEKLLFKYPFLTILILSIPAIWALFVRGFYGASDDLHIAWLYEMNAAVRAGQFPPRFVPDLSFGFGYPLFNFVFPLPFYIGEIFHLLGLSFVDSIKAVFFVSIPLSGYFMYKFLKEHTNYWLSLAGAIIYIYTPYRATDIYVRGAIGEALAFVFPPLIAWAITKKNIAILGLSVAGLLMSHNIMAYMFLPFLIIFAMIKNFNLKTFFGFLLGALISIYFWLPAIIESRLMKYDTVFNFVDHFPTIKQLITPHFGYGASVPGPYDGMSFFLGTVNLVLIAAALIFFKKLSKRVYPTDKISLWALGMIAISVFMMNFRSTLLWQHLPLIPYFQFPWRFLSLTTFATSILVISLDKFKYAKQVGVALVVLAIALNFTYFKPHDFLGRTDEYYINRYIPVPNASVEYLKTGEEYLRLPKATEKRPTEVSPNISLSSTFEVDTKTEKTGDYYKYYFPGWQVKVDEKKVEVFPGKPYGQIEYKVPVGSHKIEVVFKETLFRGILDVLSLLSLIIAITMVVRKQK